MARLSNWRPNRRRFALIVMVSVIVFPSLISATACGQKGPLIHKSPTEPATLPATDESDEREDKGTASRP